MVAKLAEVNRRTRVCKSVPGERIAENWIWQAKAPEPRVRY